MMTAHVITTPQILVATDFSDSGEAAVAVAAQYARALHAALHLFHVFWAAEVEVTRLLANAAAAIGPDVPVTVSGAGGDPADEILRYAARHAIDLIVVGTHGHTGVSRILLGSVAERVVRGARCPVLVVPAPVAVPARGVGTVSGADETAAAAISQRCIVCAKPTADLVCESCRARIRGNALEHKQREERGGRS
jgi:nucleotide-binding universal stress UspA family protein